MAQETMLICDRCGARVRDGDAPSSEFKDVTLKVEPRGRTDRAKVHQLEVCGLCATEMRAWFNQRAGKV